MIQLRGMDGKMHTWSSQDLLGKYRSDADFKSLVAQLLASIGNELENITDLLEPEFKDR